MSCTKFCEAELGFGFHLVCHTTRCEGGVCRGLFWADVKRIKFDLEGRIPVTCEEAMRPRGRVAVADSKRAVRRYLDRKSVRAKKGGELSVRFDDAGNEVRLFSSGASEDEPSEPSEDRLKACLEEVGGQLVFPGEVEVKTKYEDYSDGWLVADSGVVSFHESRVLLDGLSEEFVVPTRHPQNSSPLCADRFLLELPWGESLVSIHRPLDHGAMTSLAARAIKILQQLHAVGVRHGDLRNGILWDGQSTGSLKLGNWKLAELFVNENVHEPVEGCSTKMGVFVPRRECRSRVADLEGLVALLTELKKRNAELKSSVFEARLREFSDYVAELGFTEKPDYMRWISAFSSDTVT